MFGEPPDHGRATPRPVSVGRRSDSRCDRVLGYRDQRGQSSDVLRVVGVTRVLDQPIASVEHEVVPLVPCRPPRHRIAFNRSPVNSWFPTGTRAVRRASGEHGKSVRVTRRNEMIPTCQGYDPPGRPHPRRHDLRWVGVSGSGVDEDRRKPHGRRARAARSRRGRPPTRLRVAVDNPPRRDGIVPAGSCRPAGQCRYSRATPSRRRRGRRS